MKKLDEQTMSYLEKRIPELAEGAVKQAYCKTLTSGRRVVEAVNGQLVESNPDGSFIGAQIPCTANCGCSGTTTGSGKAMSSAIHRMRMFAGPNGSGKSTIKGVIEPELLGVYINPDDI